MKTIDLDICTCDEGDLSFALIDVDGGVIINEASELIYYQ